MELGKLQTLEIVRKVEFGVYLGTKDEQILLPKKQVPQESSIGDSVEVFVYRDSQDRLIATTNRPKAYLGEIAKLQVKDISKNGAYLDWGLEKDLFLPYKEQTMQLTKGGWVLVGVYIDKSDRLCATMKVSGYLKSNAPYEAEDIVHGTVYNLNKNYGAFVAVDNQYYGLIQNKELTKQLRIGEEIEARVIAVRPDGKLDLAVRKKAYLQIEEDAEKIVRFMEENGGKLDYTDKANPETIRQDFEMSKNEFKRAIGRLLKDKRIFIGENKIILTK